jgi:hypothetical protein
MVIGIRRNEFRFRYDLLGITINYGTLDFTVPTLGDTPRGPYSPFALLMTERPSASHVTAIHAGVFFFSFAGYPICRLTYGSITRADLTSLSLPQVGGGRSRRPEYCYLTWIKDFSRASGEHAG